jgi:murein DD-endopeptidase MepM/ murein hydrolase activator NlpD
MSTPSITGVDPSATSDTQAAAARRAKVIELAEQFESMLLSQMLRQMRQSMLSDDEGGDQLGFGSKTMTDTVDSQLAQTLSRSSRLGLSDFIVRAFDRQVQPAQGPVVSSGNGPEAVQPEPAPASKPAAVEAASPAVPTGQVSSGFGWRTDPIDGQRRFHSGTDVKMAYGQDVKAAARGQVAFVGNRGGYGLTIVVDHGGGVETRYAHLSSAPLKQGDLVEPGQVIAQAGNSGRSTGPHLHFEVLNHGQAVDPRSTAGVLAAAAGHD